MYTLRMTNIETDEIMENYYYTYDTVTTIFEDRVNTLLSFYIENYELELLDEKGTCLAYANGKHEYGGLLWKVDEDEEEWGDWDWALLEEWAEDGISAPIPKPDWDTYFAELRDFAPVFDDLEYDEDELCEWLEDEEF